jgi:hypothetical protein
LRRWRWRLVSIHENFAIVYTERCWVRGSRVNRLLKNPDPRLFKKVQMQGAREIDERRRIY